MAIAHVTLSMGFADESCLGLLSNPDYIAYKGPLSENVTYDAQQLGMSQAGEIVNSYMDSVAAEVCNGVPPAGSCMYYGMCMCAANYYPYAGDDWYGALECVVCPSGGKSNENSQFGITDCYIPAGTTGSDETGKFTYSSDCYYTTN